MHVFPTLLSMLALTGCGFASATSSDSFSALQEELASHQSAMFQMTLISPPLDDNPWLGPTGGKSLFKVWVDRNKGRTVLQTGSRRMVFPTGTLHRRALGPEAIPVGEPVETLGRGLHHILTTGFAGCTVTAIDKPTDRKHVRWIDDWAEVRCPVFKGGWGEVLLVEHGLDGAKRPTLGAIWTDVPGGRAKLVFSGAVYNETLGPNAEGAEYKPLDVPALVPWDHVPPAD